MSRNIPSAPRRILAIKLADIGDLLLVTPALRSLKESFPGVRVDVLTTPGSAPALKNSPLVDDLILFDKASFDQPADLVRASRWGSMLNLTRRLRAGRYDVVILFHHLSLRFGVLKHAALALASGAPVRIGLDNGRGWFLNRRVCDDGFGVRHELDYGLALVAAAGAETLSRRVEIALGGADLEQARAWLPETDRPTIALHPGSGGYSLARRWDPAKFVSLGRRLAEQARVVVVGTPADGVEELAGKLGSDCINLGGKTTIAGLAAVLARCDLLVGADSGVLHMASAVGTPVVALFGPTNHRAWAPVLPREKLVIVRANCACSPCAYNELGLGAPNGCPERTCMAEISVEQVMEAIIKSQIAEQKIANQQIANHKSQDESQITNPKSQDQSQITNHKSLDKSQITNLKSQPLIWHEGISQSPNSSPTLGDLPVTQSTNLPVSQSTNLPIYQSTNLPISQSPNLPISQSPILSVPVNVINYDQLLDWIGSAIASGRAHQVATVNPEFIMAARKDPIFRVVLGRADLCLPDGVGLLWASRWLHRRFKPEQRLRERVTGSDGVPLIARRAAHEGWRLFLLGAAPGVADQTAGILQERYPGLQIAGTSPADPTAEEEESIVEQVNQSGADILFVAYGAPKQDKWIARNLHRLQVGVAMGVGGSFDFICGKATRAPGWMRRMGLEWLHRLLNQPWRWRRMLALPRFAWAVFWSGLKAPENREGTP